MRLAYLYSRYPVLSQTFCDTEMLELERRGFPLLIGAVHAPLTCIRHGQRAELKAPVCYAPPSPILRVWEEKARSSGKWPAALVGSHDQKYGAEVKASTRARNALYFADLFARRGIDRFHVHFANRAAHTAIFVKALSGIPFSITAHGQDFMADLGNDDLLREICMAAEFVAVETDYSRELLARQCPEAAGKIHRVYNGMELANFAVPASGATTERAVLRIVSIGRLVPFKGFRYLIEACAQLDAREVNYSCEIIGDGPLREPLQTQIAQSGLGHRLTLTGALSQEEVRARLRACDVFALASIVDDAGTSDVFPTVILEAMASGKPVVSTHVAGIPESVIEGETGRLVPPRESAALAKALEEMARDRETRERFGAAGRRRVEERFQVGRTVEPLLELLQEQPGAPCTRYESEAPNRVAYVVDRWPDKALPDLELEVELLAKLEVPVTVFVCEYDAGVRLSEAMKTLATDFVFLPDEMVIEAEWQAHRTEARKLEDDRANAAHRAPAAAFLRSARYAVMLRKMFAHTRIAHVHATSSRVLLCATALQSLTGLTTSATIEAELTLPRDVIRDALGRCVGGRVRPREDWVPLGDSFLLEPFGSNVIAAKLRQFTRISLTGGNKLWQEWANLLRRWARSADSIQSHE